jgi:hypothetical protein
MTARAGRRSALAVCVSALLVVGAIDLARAADVTFALHIANGRVPENTRRIRVKQNDIVKLRWTADRPLTVHLHGYDLESKIAPGEVSEMTFTALATGRFTVEPHLQPSGGHAHGDILVTIEVYP